MTTKIQLRRVIDGGMEDVNPITSEECVMLEDGKKLKEVVDFVATTEDFEDEDFIVEENLVDRVESIENRIDSEFEQQNSQIATGLSNIKTVEQNISNKVDTEVAKVNAQLSDNIRHTQGWVNVKSFKCDDGIYVQGDGVHDDTSGIQRALNYCKENKVSRLLIGDGVFLISKPLIVFGSDNADLSFPNLEIVGNSCKSTVIKKINDSNLGLNKEWDLSSVIVVASDYLYKYEGQLGDNSWGEVVSSVRIKNLAIKTSVQNKCGIYFPIASVNVHLDNIEIFGVEIGVHTDHNFYLSSINRVCVGMGAYGINLDTRGIKTSLSITNCFCYGQTSASYAIRGTYSTVINCCSDGCKGDVFKLYFFNGSLISCGSESTNCNSYYNIVNSKCTLLHCSSFHQTNSGRAAIYAQGSNLTIVGGEYGTETISESYYLKSLQSNITINNAHFGETKQSTKFYYDENSTINNSFEGYCSSLIRQDSGLLFLGSKTNGNKIVFNMKDKKTTKSGVDVGWDKGFGKGDILITHDPIETNSLGMIATSLNKGEKLSLGVVTDVSNNRLTIEKTLNDTNYKAFIGFMISNQNNVSSQITDIFEGDVIQIYSSDGFATGDSLYISGASANRDVTYRHIPITIAERTFNRPTKNLFVGLQMFDTTLNKPIWWNGNNWVDSNSTKV